MPDLSIGTDAEIITELTSRTGPYVIVAVSSDETLSNPVAATHKTTALGLRQTVQVLQSAAAGIESAGSAAIT